MNKITANVEGMMCGMCEAHLTEAIRNAFPDAKKVAASRRRGVVTFLLEGAADEDAIRKAITDTGYSCLSVSSDEFKKRGLFGR